MRRLRRRSRRADEARKAPLDFRHHRLVLDGAGGGHHHVGRTIVARQIVAELVASNERTVFGVPRIERPTG